MCVFLGLTIDFSEIRVFANKGCTETHLICVSQTLTRFSYSLLDGLASTSRGLLLLNLLFFFVVVLFFFCMPHFPTCIIKCVLQSILAIFRSPDRKKKWKWKKKKKNEKRKSTRVQRPIDVQSWSQFLIHQHYKRKVIVDLSQSNMNLKVDSRKKNKVCR